MLHAETIDSGHASVRIDGSFVQVTAELAVLCKAVINSRTKPEEKAYIADKLMKTLKVLTICKAD